MLTISMRLHPQNEFNVPLISFIIIALGGLACLASGYVSQRVGVKRTAFIALTASFSCCLLSPVVFQFAAGWSLVAFLIFWGLVVIADSPMFSTLVAKYAIAESRGTALTIVNCVGFSITILSIQLINLLQGIFQPEYLFLVLAVGPGLGLLAMMRKREEA